MTSKSKSTGSLLWLITIKADRASQKTLKGGYVDLSPPDLGQSLTRGSGLRLEKSGKMQGDQDSTTGCDRLKGVQETLQPSDMGT